MLNLKRMILYVYRIEETWNLHLRLLTAAIQDRIVAPALRVATKRLLSRTPTPKSSKLSLHLFSRLRRRILRIVNFFKTISPIRGGSRSRKFFAS